MNATTIYAESAYCNMENWSDGLFRLSIPSREVKLSGAEHKALIAACIAVAACDPDAEIAPEHQEAITGLEARLDAAIASFQGNAFCKLGSRSAKDNWDAIKSGFCVRSGAEAIRLLLGSMERIPDDLMQAEVSGLSPSIWVRQWMDFPDWAEFRCLVQGRRLIGVSQYNYQDGTPSTAIVDHADDLLRQIADLVAAVILHLPTPDLVVDIGFIQGKAPIVIEINPFNDRTDPCLFRDDNPMSPSLAASFASKADGSPDFRYFGDGRSYASLAKPKIDFAAMVVEAAR